MAKIVYICLLFCCLVSVGLLGCGGDEVEEEKELLEDLVGTWELIRIDGKTPQTFLQEDENEFEVTAASMKLVFASDGSLYRELSFTFQGTGTFDTEIPDLTVDFTAGFKMKFTIKGSYVASGSTLEVILDDQSQLNVDFSFLPVSYDVDTRGIPELEKFEQELNEKAQELNQEFKERSNEFEREAEQEFKEEFGLDLTTYTWHIESDLLTLRNGDTEVYRKK